MKLRLQISQRIIAFLFDIKHQSIVSDCIRDVLTALMEDFVPKHLGYSHVKREDLQSTHMSRYFRRILNVPEDSLVTILDGTYIYVEASRTSMKSIE